MFNFSPQTNITEDPLVKPAPEVQQHVRVVAQRGKSMEELGALKVTRPSALSKSSEQLDQLWNSSTGPEGSDKDISFIAEAKVQKRGKKKQNLMEQEAKEPEIVVQKNTQGHTENQTQKKSQLKQNSEPQEDATVGTRNSSRPTSPAFCSSFRARIHSGSSGSHSPVTDEFKGFRLPNESASSLPSPRGPETGERELKSTSSTPTQTKPPFENRPCFR